MTRVNVNDFLWRHYLWTERRWTEHTPPFSILLEAGEVFRSWGDLTEVERRECRDLFLLDGQVFAVVRINI